MKNPLVPILVCRGVFTNYWYEQPETDWDIRFSKLRTSELSHTRSLTSKHGVNVPWRSSVGRKAKVESLFAVSSRMRKHVLGGELFILLCLMKSIFLNNNLSQEVLQLRTRTRLAGWQEKPRRWPFSARKIAIRLSCWLLTSKW